jgi:predicted nucleic acid-binding protein
VKVLIDTNVILDLLLAREPFVNSAIKIFAMAEQSTISAFLCATTITTVDYIINQSLSRSKSKKAVHRLMGLFEIAPVNRPVIEEALQSKMLDFEDAILAPAGNLAGVDVIITRNTKDFIHSPIKAVDPSEFLAAL